MARTEKQKAEQVKGSVAWDYVASWCMIGFIQLVCLLPYRWRVPTSGWVFGTIVSPLIGYPARIRSNLSYVMPEMSEAQKKQLERAVPRQIGRTMAELFSPKDLKAVAKKAPMTGPGLAAVDEARDAGRPIVFVSGHLANYDVARAAMIHRGCKIGGLYRRMNYRRFNEFYVDRICQIGTPMFVRGRRGLAQMLKFLRDGNAVAIMVDQHVGSGALLEFFGKPARTALSAAEMAVKYDALLVPCYAIRQSDGLSFEVFVDTPIVHTEPKEMTQALNDSLERQVRSHMDQWLWVHRRWKTKKSKVIEDD